MLRMALCHIKEQEVWGVEVALLCFQDTGTQLCSRYRRYPQNSDLGLRYTAQVTQNQRICKLSSHIQFKNLKDKRRTVSSVAECYKKYFSAALKLGWWVFFQGDRNFPKVTWHTHIKTAWSPAIRYTHALLVIANTAYFPDKRRRNLFLQCQNSQVCFIVSSPYTPFLFSITTKNSNT